MTNAPHPDKDGADTPAPFLFDPIELPRDYAICMENRRDSHIVSFGDDRGFNDEMANYKERMQERVQALPQGNCHLWANGEIVGQLEMKLPVDPDVAYVSLFYLVSSFRNRGFGRFLQNHAIKVARSLGRKRIHLSVSPTNPQAVAFYRKQGWVNEGPRPGREQMHIMSLTLADSI